MARGGRGGGSGRLLVALAMVAIALFSYFSSRTFNPVTGEAQYISLTPRQEIALGLQAAPAMIDQHGGLYPDQRYQDHVDTVGNLLVQSSAAAQTEWQFEFHLLRDPETINAFALPGGRSLSRRRSMRSWRRKGSWRAYWAMRSATSSLATAHSGLPRPS